MLFDLKQLRYALAAAKLGSYHHAARTCGVSEEAIIEGIAALDTLLGLKLFEPVGAGILPTPNGMRFLREAEHLLWRAEQIASLIAAIPGRNAAMGELFSSFEIADTPCACSDHIVTGTVIEIADRKPGATGAEPGHVPGDRSYEYVDFCRSILAARKLMARVFGSDLFADPAGEMLLDLYVREHDGITTSITTIWNASNAAYGTTRRSLSIMERRGLIALTPDTQDGRRTLVLLTEGARAHIEASLDVMLGRSATRQGDRHAIGSRREASG
jgi:hypothetical protein